VNEELKAAITGGEVAVVERLLASRPELARGLENDMSAVMLAAYYRQPAIARAILEARGPAGLFEAAALGMHGRVAELIGWDPRAVLSRSSDGYTALHLAAFFGHPDVVRVLLNGDADVEDVADNASKVRPLHSAVAGGNEEVVEALLGAGAEVEVRQERGFTPLMGAAAGGRVELVERLLAAGADKGAQNDDGKTALDFAREHHHGHLEELLSD
jgi:ankyrin repeat protein